MKFQTVRIYFLSEFSVCCHPKILLPWQRDVTTFPLSLYSLLYLLYISMYLPVNQTLQPNPFDLHAQLSDYAANTKVHTHPITGSPSSV